MNPQRQQLLLMKAPPQKQRVLLLALLGAVQVGVLVQSERVGVLLLPLLPTLPR